MEMVSRVWKPKFDEFKELLNPSSILNPELDKSPIYFASCLAYIEMNKIFNKGRYSRNRQTYRTGEYWCLYINILAVLFFYFWFYKLLSYVDD